MIELIDKLKTKYANTVSLDANETIFQTIEIFKDTPVSISYFDFSQEIPETIEEIQRYHEEYILPSYYKESGSIQWNYYIYFIYDNAEAISSDIRTLVEKNKDYARKILFNKEEFEEFLNDDISDFYQHTEAIGSDLIGAWRNKLDNNNLSMVYDEEVYKTRIVDELLLRDQEPKRKKKKKNTNINIIFPTSNNAFIDTLCLGEYQKYPEKRNFKFGSVNLIHGVNGAGKTSLLEAIEIVTCGKTFRNKNDDETNINGLRLKFQDKIYTVAKDNTTFRARDKFWYGSAYEKGNKLYEGFNKFNFYNSDAAYNISSEKNTYETIKNLVLGKEISFYERRVEASLENFKAEQRRLTKESASLKLNISKAKKDIKKLNESTMETDDLQKKLILCWASLGREIDLLNKDKEDELYNMLFEVSQLRECIHKIKELSDDTNVRNLLEIPKVLNDIVQDVTILNDTMALIVKIKAKRKEFLKNIEMIHSKIANLQKLSEWLNVDNISSLEGLEERLKKLKSDKYDMEFLMRDIPLAEEINSQLNTKKELTSFYYALVASNVKLEKSRNEKIETLKTLEESVGKLSTYKNNLQENVLKILSLSDTKTKCPVCRTSFSENTLNELVKEITIGINHVEDINILKKDIESLVNQIKSNEKQIDIVDAVLSIPAELFPNIILGSASGEKVIREIQKARNKLEALQYDIDNLEKQKQYFLSMGITEIEYSRFLDNYNERYRSKFGDLSQETIEEIKQKYMLEFSTQEETLESYDEKIKIQENIIQRLNNKHKVGFEKPQELKEYFLNRKNKLLDMKKQRDIMQQYINPRNMEVEYIVRNVSELSIVEDRLSTALRLNKKTTIATESLQNELDTYKKRCKILIQSLKKLKKAINILDELESSEQRLSTFFEKNTQGILEVFMNIHAPKEFDELNFKDGIQLKRIGSESDEPLSKISTGQKSALALSIFLTMNKNAQNAPKYILFDDPVSDIDDINILAFFDFLREIALSGKRQIFFATASSKIANLFKKKFDFLGEDFVYHYLER